MIDSTIGVLLDPPAADATQSAATIEATIQEGYAFVALPIDKDDHQLVDVLEAIKAAEPLHG